MNGFPRRRSAHLLLVEDSPADARYLREVFKESKLRNHLHHVTDAESALSFLRDADTLPDLVLLDMHLPGMQGAELVAAVRADARLASLPIVLLAPSQPHAERLREDGVDAQCCLLKPIQVPDLLRVVARIDSLAVSVVAEDEAA
jgi:chemotaxis family two-component system response regulator Rcp1